MYVKVKVRAGVKRESFEKISVDHFEIAVKEEAQQNQANKRVLALLAEHYVISIGRVRIVSGHHSGSKILNIDV